MGQPQKLPQKIVPFGHLISLTLSLGKGHGISVLATIVFFGSSKQACSSISCPDLGPIVGQNQLSPL